MELIRKTLFNCAGIGEWNFKIQFDKSFVTAMIFCFENPNYYIYNTNCHSKNFNKYFLALNALEIKLNEYAQQHQI